MTKLQAARDRAERIHNTWADPLKPTEAERAAWEQARDEITAAERAETRSDEADQGVPRPTSQKTSSSLSTKVDPTLRNLDRERRLSDDS